MSRLSALERSWRYVRAGLIALLLVLGFVAGWPARMPKLVRGWPPSLARVALLLPSLQRKVLTPFAPAAGALGITTEDWALFTGTGGTRYRMWLEGRTARGDYELLYRAHDPEHAYLGGSLEYRRVMNIWNPHHDWISSSYPAFTRWAARRVFHERRRFRAVRVRMEQVRILPHGAGFEPSGRFVYEELVRREDVRP
jgi:hypothetical protein